MKWLRYLVQITLVSVAERASSGDGHHTVWIEQRGP